MKNMMFIGIGCVVLSVTCVAEPFHLKHDKTGKIYGPFQSTTGSPVKLGKTHFTVVSKSRNLSAVEKQLMAVKIAKVDFKQAPLQDVVHFLLKESRIQDPENIGVNFIIESLPRKIGAPADPSPTVTLSMTNVSAFELLEMLMDLTGYSYKTSDTKGTTKVISENTVVINP